MMKPLAFALPFVASLLLFGCDNDVEYERYVYRTIDTCEELLEHYVIESRKSYNRVELTHDEQNNIYRMCIKKEQGFVLKFYKTRRKVKG